MQEVRSQDLISRLIHFPVNSEQRTDVVYTPFSGVLPSKMTRYSLRHNSIEIAKTDDEGRFVFNIPISTTDHVIYDVSFIIDGCVEVEGIINAEIVAVFSDGEEKVISRRFVTEEKEMKRAYINTQGGAGSARGPDGDLIIKPRWMFKESMTGLPLFRMKKLTTVKIILSIGSAVDQYFPPLHVKCGVSLCSLHPTELQAHKDEEERFMVTVEDINLKRGGKGDGEFVVPLGSTVKSIRWSVPTKGTPTTLSIPHLVDRVDTRLLQHDNEYSCDVRSVAGLDRIGNTFFSGITDMIVSVPGASTMIATIVRMWEVV